MPLSRSPDISLSMLFSISLPHICWYSRNTTHISTNPQETGKQTEKDTKDLPLFTNPEFIPALRWDLLLAHKMALNLDSSVPSLFSPAAYRACLDKSQMWQTECHCTQRNQGLTILRHAGESLNIRHQHEIQRFYLSILFSQRDVDIFSFIPITLQNREQHIS